jgi:hypothetical protein
MPVEQTGSPEKLETPLANGGRIGLASRSGFIPARY